MEPRQLRPGTPQEHFNHMPGASEAYQQQGGTELGDTNKRETRPEISRPAPIEAEPIAPVAVVPMPLVSASPAVDDAATTQASTSTSGPSVAADDDLIEREWVDKAKKIIEETKDNPYKREQEIGKLQRDYIKKRYGRDIGESGD